MLIRFEFGVGIDDVHIGAEAPEWSVIFSIIIDKGIAS